jgi:RNA polymerase sigma factor for flagellar operon FliA
VVAARRQDRREITDALWARYVASRDAGTRDLLLEQYLGLVHHAAREIAHQRPHALETEDLVSAGTVGLVQALETFDPSRGLAFSSFAVPRIRGAILDELRSWDWVPRSVRQRSREIRKTRRDLERRLGRSPEPSEIAEALGMDLESYFRCQVESESPVLLSIDPLPGDGQRRDAVRGETIPDRSAPGVVETIERGETLARLRGAFASLSVRDRLVLTLSFFEELTLSQIGAVLHVTESRVSQIRTRALRRLLERIEHPEDSR